MSMDDDDRGAVVTTRNGDVVEWRVFDDAARAKEHYVRMMGRLRDSVHRSTEDEHWEVMLCSIDQYALSRPSDKA